MHARWATRLLCGATIVSAPLTAVIPAYAASGQGAQKATLYDVSADFPGGWACAQGATDTTTPTKSFVVWNLASNGTMQVTVSIKGGTPDVSYDVWVESNGATGASCPPGTGSASNPDAVVTNHHGNGTAHFSFSPVDGASYWLTAWAGSPGGGNNGLRSQIVTPE
jgi:hypothetical protein